MNYDASFCLVVLLALRSEWRVLRFELVSFVAGRLETTSANLLSTMCGVLKPECLLLSCCKTLGASFLDYAIFYIPSPSDVGIVFLLRLTTAIIMGVRLNNRLNAL